jgi:hypothetical protein
LIIGTDSRADSVPPRVQKERILPCMYGSNIWRASRCLKTRLTPKNWECVKVKFPLLCKDQAGVQPF